MIRSTTDSIPSKSPFRHRIAQASCDTNESFGECLELLELPVAFEDRYGNLPTRRGPLSATATADCTKSCLAPCCALVGQRRCSLVCPASASRSSFCTSSAGFSETTALPTSASRWSSIAVSMTTLSLSTRRSLPPHPLPPQLKS